MQSNRFNKRDTFESKEGYSLLVSMDITISYQKSGGKNHLITPPAEQEQNKRPCLDRTRPLQVLLMRAYICFRLPSAPPSDFSRVSCPSSNTVRNI